MFEERRLHPRVKLLAGGFVAVALGLVLLQSVAVFGLGGLFGVGKASMCSTSHSASQRHLESALFDGWQELQLGTCSGPQFAGLEDLSSITGDADDEETLDYNRGTGERGYLLTMNCTRFFEGGEGEAPLGPRPKAAFSFSFEESSRLQFPYLGPTQLLAGGHATSEVEMGGADVYVERWAEREYVVGKCTIPGLFGQRQTFTNVLVKHESNTLVRDRALRRRLQLDLEREAAASSAPAEARADGKSLPAPVQSMNVLVLLVSVLSESHMRRTMPLTLQALEMLKSKQAPETSVFHFERFHTVARDPLRNQVALFGGRDSDSMSGDVTRGAKGWLWNWYQAQGYVTMFSEEHCILDNSVRKFFATHPPFDHRFTDIFCQIASDPYFGSSQARLKGIRFDDDEDDEVGGVGATSIGQEQVREERGWQRGKSCAGNKYLHTLVLEYTAQFFAAYKRERGERGDYPPLFATVTLMEAHEPSMLRVRTLDRSLAHFLKMLHADGYLEDTAVVLASDMGQYRNSFARSPLGKKEMREPFMYAIVPERFLKAYPETRAALQHNIHQVCTAYDVYAALRRIPTMFIKSMDGRPTGEMSSSFNLRQKDPLIPSEAFSLFDEFIPVERSCSDAPVEGGMCRCDGSGSTSYDLLALYAVSLLLACILLLWWCWIWLGRRRT